MAITELWLVRHGESVGNLAATAAAAQRAHVVEVEARDADVQLSATGLAQAEALGAWLGASAEHPTVAFSSPYVRAEQTLLQAINRAGITLPTVVDERLRDRELGILDMLTHYGIAARFPEEAKRRAWHGKFYYRPPGGESWVDVAFRVRSFLTDLGSRGIDGPVLIVAHDAVIMLFLYVCLGMHERELLDFAKENTVLNASITKLSRTSTGWSLDAFAWSGHLEALGAPVTEHAGDPDVHPR